MHNGLGPLEWRGVLVPSLSEPVDGLTDLAGVGGAQVTEDRPGKDSEPDFNLVEPGGVGRRVVEVDLGVARQPAVMLGLAVGDALGNTTEGLLPQQRMSHYGEIRNYLPNSHAQGAAIGLPSNDTQMAFWTLQQMLADGGFNPEHVARRFCRDRIFGIGSTVKDFIRNYHSGMVWH